MNTQKLSTRSIVTVAMFAAVLCVSAYISVPLPNGSHITFLNFIVTIIALTLPFEQSVLTILIWLLLGAVGVPVFIGGSAGAGYLVGPYGGYSFAFLAVAILLPILCNRKYNRIYFTAISVMSAILVDMIGTIWLMAVAHMTFSAAFIAGFLPFIPLDLVKTIVAAQIVPQFKRIVQTELN